MKSICAKKGAVRDSVRQSVINFVGSLLGYGEQVGHDAANGTRLFRQVKKEGSIETTFDTVVDGRFRRVKKGYCRKKPVGGINDGIVEVDKQLLELGADGKWNIAMSKPKEGQGQPLVLRNSIYQKCVLKDGKEVLRPIAVDNTVATMANPFHVGQMKIYNYLDENTYKVQRFFDRKMTKEDHITTPKPLNLGNKSRGYRDYYWLNTDLVDTYRYRTRSPKV